MKFNFEKAKEVIKKVAVTAGVSAISLNSIASDKTSEKEIKNIDNKSEIKISNFVTKNLNSEIHYYDIPQELKKNKESLNRGDKELLSQIHNLEKGFSEISNEKGIDVGSFSVISYKDILDQKYNNEYDGSTSNNKVTRTSPLNNEYITDVVSSMLINKIDGIKMKDIDYSGMGEAMKLQNEGYVDYKVGGFVNKKPEYYFTIKQNQKNDSLVVFEIKLVKNNQVINTTTVEEHLPNLNSINEKDLNTIVDTVIAPDIMEAIKDKIIELKLNIYE